MRGSAVENSLPLEEIANWAVTQNIQILADFALAQKELKGL